ncbi:MAG: hypothetical protein ABIQ12_04285 [Opitutaceae bacterium]
MSPFETYESIYWIFTQLCNDHCAHCYNDSGPQGERLSLDESLAIVADLPARLGRLILSGGETPAGPFTIDRAAYGVRTIAGVAAGAVTGVAAS